MSHFGFLFDDMPIALVSLCVVDREKSTYELSIEPIPPSDSVITDRFVLPNSYTAITLYDQFMQVIETAVRAAVTPMNLNTVVVSEKSDNGVKHCKTYIYDPALCGEIAPYVFKVPTGLVFTSDNTVVLLEELEKSITDKLNSIKRS